MPATQTVIMSGSFGSGIHRRVMDPTITWPTPFTRQGFNYWIHLYRDDAEEAISRLGVLEAVDVAWATSFAWFLMNR